MSSLLRLKPPPLVVSCVVLALLALRFLAPDKDPPVAYVHYGQTLISDPYHLTFAARNATLSDEGESFDYHRWDVFKNSLVSGVAYLTFMAFGVSRTTANIAGILLSTGGILLFLCGFLGRRAWSEISITAAMLLLNNLLFVNGRLPFLETGLIYLSGCLFYIFVRFHNQWWGQFLSGILVAIAVAKKD